jgi:hypothetical protein
MSAASPMTRKTFFNSDVPNHPTGGGSGGGGGGNGGGTDQTVAQALEDDSGHPDDDIADTQRPVSPRKFHRSHGVRVLPVYVLSLVGLDKDLLLDGDSLVSACLEL